MRRSGSSSCMLRPKSEVLEGDKMSVTLINTQPLPTYSCERFYMLSEVEVNAHSTTFLCDVLDCDQTQSTVESSEASLAAETTQQQQQQPSRYSTLYVLWRPDEISSVRAFAEGTLLAAIQQCKSVMTEQCSNSGPVSTTSTSPESSPTRRKSSPRHDTSPNIYLVVDIAASLNESSYSQDDDDAAKRRQFQVKVDTAERLARHVAQSTDFRSSIHGITVGISNHVRAAPGLEACLDAFLLGSRHRRQCNSRETKSSIGLVALHPNDLLGLQDETVTDAAQGVLQSRTCAEWNGNGNLQTFANRAHSEWCVAHGVEEEKDPPSPDRKARRKRRNGFDGDFEYMDPLLTCMMIFFVGYVLSQLWMSYFA